MQENGIDCGAFICQYAKILAGSSSARPDFHFKADEMINIRKEMAIEIRDLKITSLAKPSHHEVVSPPPSLL